MADVKVCLIVIDGWGLSDEQNGNAIAHAQTPVMTALSQDKERFLTLDASGLAVGLPKGLMGNSEVGHLNIGAGRPVFQDIVRINLDMENKKLGANPRFLEACENAKKNGGRLHLLGLVSDGGVHSHIDHLCALLEGAKAAHVPKTFVHFFGDGRDTSPTSAAGYLDRLLQHMAAIQYGELADITGRYYAMDRDKRWERIKVAYDGLVAGAGETVENAQEARNLIDKRYNLPENQGRETDEFLKPIIVKGLGRIQDNDTLVFFNFRSDRMREIVETFGVKRNFETDNFPKNLYVACMTQYNQAWTFPLLYPPANTENTLSEWISHKKFAQFHCAETEKYAHVTFFFNGGKETQVEGEERCMVPSPKVPTYDHQPEMSSAGVADKMIEAIGSGKYKFVMCNFAPPDMVGHTGVYEAAVKAVTATDIAIGRISEACKQHNYVLLITADHGNAEQMLAPDGQPHTAHTTNRVPFIMAFTSRKFLQPSHNAALADVAPTVLDLMDLGKPNEMDGQSLLAPA
ncbi:2,3-bisphosphoglycerate-independent phosphoglycerate mutase-like [Paramacrobiotus metropolitanus]|uniref:2,3-bisphosphoglycerate-independent phosphoglycerate mutase-like n=1 Tax=Paramacrobiotus metropolitanus TaxID=2943436 RepID=UPI002446050F|nr:2,3-bisphosphoglycerate-independent phosphoglycerate mutase-like [Paramacrobiotus metropolitanus]